MKYILVVVGAVILVVLLAYAVWALLINMHYDDSKVEQTMELTSRCELVAAAESPTRGDYVDFRLHRCYLPGGTICYVSSAGGLDCE